MSTVARSSPPTASSAELRDVLRARVEALAAQRKRLEPAQRMVAVLLERAAAAAGRLLASSRNEDALVTLEDALRAYGAFQVTFAKTNVVVVYRMAFIRRMYEQLDAMLALIYKAEVLAGQEEGDALKIWQDKLADARTEEEKELSAVAKRSTMPFARNVKGHEAMEALTLMKFEIDFYPPPRNSKTHVASMKAVFFSIVRSSNGRVTKIPPWFSPVYMVVSEDAAALDGGSGLATCSRARWADRHQDGAVVDVVVKRIPLDAEGIDAFRREVEIWYAVSSQYVVKLLSASHCSAPTVLVLEDAEFSTLRAYLALDNGAHRDELWTKAREAALGLQYLREHHQSVHGNLKRSNILVGADGIAKVTDFGGGFVTLQNLAIQHNEWGEGVINWRAPEFRSYRKRPSYQGDVFSLALCIVDAIVDDFKLPTTEQLERNNGLERPVGLSDRAWELIQGMTAFRPEDRMPLTSVIDVLGELEKDVTKHFDLHLQQGLSRQGSEKHGLVARR